MSAGAGRWGDLLPRVGSAIVMLGLGGAAIWAGGWWFASLTIIVTGLMIWELARMTSPRMTSPKGHKVGAASVLLGLLAALVLALTVVIGQPLLLALLVLPSVLGLLVARRDGAIYAGYGLLIMLSGVALIALRGQFGLMGVIWLLAVIVASDVMGYFVGRTLGGPKFWPKVSPKKTWSGTIAGWVGASIVGLGFWQCGFGTTAILWASPLIAFAGQMGDVVESAIKRRSDVKDSSNLIPGHGGVLDRFDALAFGAVLTMILQGLLVFMPQGQG